MDSLVWMYVNLRIVRAISAQQFLAGTFVGRASRGGGIPTLTLPTAREAYATVGVASFVNQQGDEGHLLSDTSIVMVWGDWRPHSGGTGAGKQASRHGRYTNRFISATVSAGEIKHADCQQVDWCRVWNDAESSYMKGAET